jgi:hypothetical protein
LYDRKTLPLRPTTKRQTARVESTSFTVEISFYPSVLINDRSLSGLPRNRNVGRVVGAVSIGSFEVSRWRLWRMRCAMGIESILVLKALPDGDFGRDAFIDLHRISRTHLRHPTSGAIGYSRGQFRCWCLYTR